MIAWRAAAVLCLAAGTAQAPMHAEAADALAWLRKIQDATRNLS